MNCTHILVTNAKGDTIRIPELFFLSISNLLSFINDFCVRKIKTKIAFVVKAARSYHCICLFSSVLIYSFSSEAFLINHNRLPFLRDS